MIREAAISDARRLVEMANRFFEGGYFVGEYDPVRFLDWVTELIAESNSFVLIGPNSMSAASLFVPPYTDVMVASEHWLYAEKGEGRAMLNALEDEAKRRGAKFISVTAQTSKRGDVVEKMYARRGYERQEIAMVKGL